MGHSTETGKTLSNGCDRRPQLISSKFLYSTLARLYSENRTSFPPKLLVVSAAKIQKLLPGSSGQITSVEAAVDFLTSIDTNPFEPNADAKLRRTQKAWIIRCAFNDNFEDAYVDEGLVGMRLSGVTCLFSGPAPEDHSFPLLFSEEEDEVIWAPFPTTEMEINDPLLVNEQPLPLTAFGVYQVYAMEIRPHMWEHLDTILQLMLNTLEGAFREPLRRTRETLPEQMAGTMFSDVHQIISMFENNMTMCCMTRDHSYRVRIDADSMEKALILNSIQDTVALSQLRARLEDSEVRRADAYHQLLVVSENLDKSETSRVDLKSGNNSKANKKLNQAKTELKAVKDELQSTNDKLEAALESANKLRKERDALRAEAERARSTRCQLDEALSESEILRSQLNKACSDSEEAEKKRMGAISHDLERLKDVLVTSLCRSETRDETTQTETETQHRGDRVDSVDRVDWGTQTPPPAVWQNPVNARLALEGLLETFISATEHYR